MLESYFENVFAKMTKETYFEMCEALGTEPVEEEIPIEMEDFPDFIQQCFVIYEILPDCWDSMGGNYIGKDYTIVFNLFRVYKVTDSEEILLAINFLQNMDNVRQRLIQQQIKAKSPQQ